MCINILLYDGEAKPGSVLFVFGHKRIEKAVHYILRDARAIIANSQHQTFFFNPARYMYKWLFNFMVEKHVGRIIYQVAYHPAQIAFIAGHYHAIGHISLNRDTAASFKAFSLVYSLERYFIQVDRFF